MVPALCPIPEISVIILDMFSVYLPAQAFLTVAAKAVFIDIPACIYQKWCRYISGESIIFCFTALNVPPVPYPVLEEINSMPSIQFSYRNCLISPISLASVSEQGRASW